MNWFRKSKPQVFICHVPRNGQREAWLETCLAEWKRKAAREQISVLNPDSDGPVAFQRKRRIMAETAAESDFYIVADDDCLPIGQDFIERGIEILKRHPEFAILSPLPTNEGINEWTPGREDNYTAFKDGEVFEHVSVGGIRFCRKGAMADWPPMKPGWKDYDRIQGDFLRLQGKRVGYMRYLSFEHLGKGVTTVWDI